MYLLRICRFTSIALFFALCTVATAADQSSAPDDSAKTAQQQKQFLQELKKVNARLDAMNARLDKLQKQFDKLKKAGAANNNPPAMPGVPNPNQGGPDMAKLNKIKLPKNPNHKQLMRYIQKIADATAGQRMISDSDPQTRMLMKVGSKHVDALIDALGENLGGNMGPGLDYYLVPAITRLAGPDNKKAIINHLSDNRQLIKIITNKGWEQDAKKTLIKVLKSHPRHLPSAWIQAVASFEDKSTYDALKHYFIVGDNKAQTFRIIEYLPGIKLNDAVTKAWQRAKHSMNPWGSMMMARVAIRYGHVDALGIMIDKLGNKQWGGMGPFGQSIRSLVLRHIRFRGSDKKIKAWFNKHHSQLQFNKQSETFYVAQGLSLAPCRNPWTPGVSV